MSADGSIDELCHCHYEARRGQLSSYIPSPALELRGRRGVSSQRTGAGPDPWRRTSPGPPSPRPQTEVQHPQAPALGIRFPHLDTRPLSALTSRVQPALRTPELYPNAGIATSPAQEPPRKIIKPAPAQAPTSHLPPKYPTVPTPSWGNRDPNFPTLAPPLGSGVSCRGPSPSPTPMWLPLRPPEANEMVVWGARLGSREQRTARIPECSRLWGRNGPRGRPMSRCFVTSILPPGDGGELSLWVLSFREPKFPAGEGPSSNGVGHLPRNACSPNRRPPPIRETGEINGPGLARTSSPKRKPHAISRRVSTIAQGPIIQPTDLRESWGQNLAVLGTVLMYIHDPWILLFPIKRQARLPPLEKLHFTKRGWEWLDDPPPFREP